MAKDWTAQLDTVDFRCGGCRHAWAAAPDLIEDSPDDEHHPHRYFGTCPKCQRENQPQAAWARNLMRAHQAATVPKTAEGLAKVRQNLAGHPNGEAQRRTRFNAMKHGMAAKTATYFPAKPDGYRVAINTEVLANNPKVADFSATLSGAVLGSGQIPLNNTTDGLHPDDTGQPLLAPVMGAALGLA